MLVKIVVLVVKENAPKLVEGYHVVAFDVMLLHDFVQLLLAHRVA